MIYIEGSSSLGKILTTLLLQQAIENLSASLGHRAIAPADPQNWPIQNTAVEKITFQRTDNGRLSSEL